MSQQATKYQDKDFDFTLANILRDQREAMVGTLRQMSERSGVPRKTIHTIERGKQLPKWETLLKLIKVIGWSEKQAKLVLYQAIRKQHDTMLRKKLGL